MCLDAAAPSLPPCPPLPPSETCYLEVDRSTGIRAVTTPIDPRSPYFVAMRNVSQIENAVAHYEANARGADLVRKGGGFSLGRAFLKWYFRANLGLWQHF
jgi:hypothetical protein